MKLQDLPEGCIAHIISHTTPVDACRLCLVSKGFQSAAESDTVWDRFLLSDLTSAVVPPSSISKKTLYLSLCPVMIDQGRKSFQLDERTGKKCYMLSARDLAIIWGDTNEYWQWTTLPESRFEEVAKLRHVCWFEISGKINTRILSSNTHYAAFLVFKMISPSGFYYHPTVLSISNIGGNSNKTNVCLDPNIEARHFRGLGRPNERSDGWLEIEMGDFFNSSLEEKEVHMKVAETTSNMWKRGFILEGIEVRPKHV